MTDAASPAAAAAAAAGVPTGWKLVPVEPTPEMCAAATEQGGYDNRRGTVTVASNLYRAMLLASPVAPVGAPTRQHVEGFLCRAWGESDLPEARLVRTRAAWEAFVVEAQWGSDATYAGLDSDDDREMVDEQVNDIAEGMTDSGKGQINFEIGGLSIERVTFPGCELATDATKQQSQHSVHLAATPIGQDFRMRPASSEAAPSAEGSALEALREMADEGQVLISAWVFQGDVLSYRLTARGRDGWRKTADGKTLEAALAAAGAADWKSPREQE